MKASRISLIVLLSGLSLCAMAGLAVAQETESDTTVTTNETQFCKGETIRIREGETRNGDGYFFGRNISVQGRQLGDMIGMAQSTVISGEVDGDIAFAGQSLEITQSGRVLDTIRFFGDSLLIRGRVEGDVVAFAGQINISPDATITGSLHLFGAIATIEGEVAGGLRFGGGKLFLGGGIAGDADITADQIEINEGAQIGGDLAYSTRSEMEFENPEFVTGTITFEPKAEKEDEDKPFFTTRKLLVWLWFTIAAMLVGFVALGVSRRTMPALTSAIGREGMLVALIGLGIFLVVPAASALAIVLVVSLPLGVVSLLIFVVALYLAQLPVAVWLGERILALAGRSAVSPFLALALGIVALYLLYEIPYLGLLLRLGTIWLGLGSMIVATRTYLQQRPSETA